MKTYIYLGDRHTDASLKGAVCTAVLNSWGKCVTGNGSMLVRFNSRETVVIRRLLRKLPTTS